MFEIHFDSIRQLKKHIWDERRREDFESILATQKPDNYIEITVKTTNQYRVECLEDLRYWTDYYQGEKTVNGVQLFARCQELSDKYGTQFLFEYIPPKTLSKKERFEKLELEMLEHKKKVEEEMKKKESGFESRVVR